MKIALVTVHRTLNYGTMLQTYACKLLFKKYGYDMIVIDYHRANDYSCDDLESLKKYYIFRKKQCDQQGWLRSLILLVKCALSYRSVKRFYQICSSFLENHITLTKRYDSFEEIVGDVPAADLYCAGSDQIWNSDYNHGVDAVYYLNFAPDDSYKFSFSSSIGKETLSEIEAEQIRSYLKDFNAISVREDSAKTILNGLDLNAKSILDPTLLIDAEYWENMCGIPTIEKPYLLIYKLKGDDKLDLIAHKIAAEKKLRIVRITFDNVRKKKGEITVALPSISAFLSLIKNAEYVVTNSFHGTCFSINFNKQFLVVARSSYNTRIINILSKLKLINRIYSGDSTEWECDEMIDYEIVNTLLAVEREKAEKWLKQVLNDKKIDSGRK